MKSRRRGYSLVECLVVISLIGGILGTVATTLSALYRTDQGMREALTYDRALDRFIVQLRSDAHQAVSATVGKAGDGAAAANQLLLALQDGRSIRYTLHAQRAERVVRRDQTVEHTESYPVVSSPVAWQLREDRASPIVSLVLKLRPARRDQSPAGAATYRIDAAVRLVRVQPSAPKT
jgi:prepilin-type N-terminal cleavage/methylation domain-containing protein